MSKIKVDEPVKEPTPKTEEQIRAELQAEYEKIADKKVTGALKKQEKRWADKLMQIDRNRSRKIRPDRRSRLRRMRLESVILSQKALSWL